MESPDYKKWIEKIDELVGSDFCHDMECRLIRPDAFTQEEAQQMADLLGKIYSIAHRVHCGACRDRPLD